MLHWRLWQGDPVEFEWEERALLGANISVLLLFQEWVMRLLAVLLLVLVSTSSAEAQSGTRGGMRGSARRRASPRSYHSAPSRQSYQAQSSSQGQGTVAAPAGGDTTGCATCTAGAAVVDTSAPVVVESAAPCCTQRYHSHCSHRSYGRSRRHRRCR